MKYILPLLLIVSAIPASSSQSLTLCFRVHLKDGTTELIPGNAPGISFTWSDFRIHPDYYPGESAYALFKPEILFAKLGLSNRIADVNKIEVSKGECEFIIRGWTGPRYHVHSVETPYKKGIKIKQVVYPAYIKVYKTKPQDPKQKVGSTSIIETERGDSYSYDIMTTMTTGAEETGYCYIKFRVFK